MHDAFASWAQSARIVAPAPAPWGGFAMADRRAKQTHRAARQVATLEIPPTE